MTGTPGIYNVYQKTADEERGVEAGLVGRFVVYGNNVSIIEDHTGMIESMFPAGPITGQLLRRMKSMENGQSAYWDVVLESDIDEGKRPDLVEELNLGSDNWPTE
jgi:hypothetical protein